MHKHKRRLISMIIAFGMLLPGAAAQGITVNGIELQAAPNAVGVRWQKPVGASVNRYKVYYAKESILENNGRFLDAEETLGDQTDIALLDLLNRGFVAGDTLYVTVTAIDAQGMEHRVFGEEKNIAVVLPEGNTPHAAASIALENAVAEGETTIRLVFTAPVAVPEGHPSSHFTITGENGDVVYVLSLMAEGNALIIRTSPMNVRDRYTITALSTLKGADGTAVDPSKNSVSFVARPSGAETEVSVPSSSSSSSSVAATVPAPEPVVQMPSNTSSSSSPTPVQIPQPEPQPIPVPDITPPEDATNLVLRRILQPDGNYTVKATWEESLDTAKDLASYKIYESDDEGKSFAGPTVLLGTVISSTIANIPPGTFTLKLTAADRTGNESHGIMETIILPETGAATLLLASLGAAAISARRTRKRVQARK